MFQLRQLLISVNLHLALRAVESQTHAHAVLRFQVKWLMPCRTLSSVLHAIAQSKAQTITAGHKRRNSRRIRSAASLVVRVQLERLWSVLHAMSCIVCLRYRVGNVSYVDCIGIYSCCCSLIVACRLDIAEPIPICSRDSCSLQSLNQYSAQRCQST